MANAILNFHFDFLKPSLSDIALLGGVELSYKGNYCELVIWLFWVELRCDKQNKEDY